MTEASEGSIWMPPCLENLKVMGTVTHGRNCNTNFLHPHMNIRNYQLSLSLLHSLISNTQNIAKSEGRLRMKNKQRWRKVVNNNQMSVIIQEQKSTRASNWELQESMASKFYNCRSWKSSLFSSLNSPLTLSVVFYNFYTGVKFLKKY